MGTSSVQVYRYLPICRKCIQFENTENDCSHQVTICVTCGMTDYVIDECSAYWEKKKVNQKTRCRNCALREEERFNHSALSPFCPYKLDYIDTVY